MDEGERCLARQRPHLRFERALCAARLAVARSAPYSKLRMARDILLEAKIHPSIRQKVATYRDSSSIKEVQAAIAEHDVVVVGMSQNPFPRRARRLLDSKGIPYKYLGYGSYLSQWRVRLPLKMWSGWPTFPMIFVKGTLIGGFRDLEQLLAEGQFEQLLHAPRS